MAKTQTQITTFIIRTEKSFDDGSTAETSLTTSDKNNVIEEIKKHNDIMIQQLNAEIGLNHFNFSVLIQKT